MRARVFGIRRHGRLDLTRVHHQVIEGKLVRDETAARSSQAGRQ